MCAARGRSLEAETLGGLAFFHVLLAAVRFLRPEKPSRNQSCHWQLVGFIYLHSVHLVE